MNGDLLLGFNKIIPLYLMGFGAVITRSRPKAGDRVLKCSWFVYVVVVVVFLVLPILHFGH